MNKTETNHIPQIRFPEFANDGGWKDKTLGEIGNFIGGGTPDTTNSEYWNGDIQWYTPTEVKEGILGRSIRTITKEGLNNSSAKLLPKGALLITTRATIGDIAIANAECSTNQGFQSLVVNEKEVNTFWYYWILHHKKELISKSSGSTFPEIGKNEIVKIKVLRPGKDEQQKVASCLSSLDEVIAAHTQKLEALKEHKKGLMQNLFPQEGETVPKMRFPEFLAEGDWVEKRLGEIADLTSSKRIHLADYVASGIPFFRGKEISQLKNTNVLEDILYISTEHYNDIKEKYGVPELGDILITAVGTLGNVYRVKDDKGFYFKDGNLIWLKNINIDSAFVELLLDVKKEKVLASAIGSSQKALTMVALNKLQFVVPISLSEQRKIAECLSSMNVLITNQMEKVEQLKIHKKGLMQRLFPKMID